jgi:hypothetical protein
MSPVRAFLSQLGIVPRQWQQFEPPKDVVDRLSLYEHERIVRLAEYSAAWRMHWIEEEIGQRLAAKHEATLRPKRPVLVRAIAARGGTSS